MKRRILLSLFFLCAACVAAQVPVNTHIQILKAEDARSFNTTLENLMSSPNAAVRERAALAAGRIGNEAAITVLTSLLEKDIDDGVRAMAAFALGEIESIKAAEAILAAMKAETRAVASVPVTARLVEAAGKIAAANPRDEKSKQLLEAILTILDEEDRKGTNQNREVILLALTAAGRAGALDPKRKRPDDTDFVIAKFLKHADARIRADAGNTLTRLRSRNANVVLRTMLEKDTDPVARANAARALGAAEDREAVDRLLKAATEDKDSRVRVSAIRSLGNLRDAKTADKLIERGGKLLIDYKKSRYKNPQEENELLEVASLVGRLLAYSEKPSAVKFLFEFRKTDKFRSAEIEIALATVAPKFYFENIIRGLSAMRQADPRTASVIYQGYGRIQALVKKDEYKEINSETNFQLLKFAEGWFWNEDKTKYSKGLAFPVPEMLKAFTADKSDSLGILLPILEREEDVFIRSTIAELLAEQPKSKESIEKLTVAFAKALVTDKNENDAQLAILDTLYKLDKKEAVGSLLRALNAPDYVLRKKAIAMLEDKDLQKENPEIATALNLARANRMDEVLPYHPGSMAMSRNSTRLGQILNTDADYRRALPRKNGSVKAVLRTEKGSFTIDFFPEEAPLTVDNFIKLARRGYFNGLEVHRVVPNFVMQDGDPRGDGNGGPGWSIRCEINMLPYDRGAVGMALSGKDTGGSQWFVTHSPQPHLDGGYTVFGRVSEADMKVVDNIVRGDKIISIRIVERRLPQKAQKPQKVR